MNLISLFRPPLVWLVAVEAALVAVLCLVTWHVWQQRVAPLGTVATAPMPAPLASTAPRAGQLRPPPAPSSAPPGVVPRAGPAPGISTDAGFLSREMAELNRVESAFEDLEWRVTSALADAIQSYVTRVVLPSIERSEGG